MFFYYCVAIMILTLGVAIMITNV